MVHFGAGAIPEQVMTPFESHAVLLSDYPPGMAHTDLLQLTEPFGAVKNTTISLRPTGGVQAHIEFSERSHAAQAAVSLNGVVIDQLSIRAHLDSVASVGGSAHEPEAERQIKLVWDAPSVSGWAFYPNVGVAKAESARLNGILYGVRKIAAEYRTAKQKHSIPVYLTGLPLHVNRDDLHTFCAGSSSVSLNPPNYLNSPNENIRAFLAGFGPIESFEVLPTDPSHLKITGFAKFSTREAAANAVRALKGTPHAFLGKGCISVQPVFHFKYDCANCPFALIRDNLDSLRNSCADSCTLLYYDEPPCVHIYARKAKALAPVRKSLEAFLFGFELVCWDAYFETSSGEKTLNRINTDMSFHIRIDKRRRVLRIWGDQAKGEKQITHLLKQVHGKRHILRLNTGLMRVVLTGGLQSLHDAFGASKILLSLQRQEITAMGVTEAEVDSQLKLLASGHSRGSGSCCLCFSEDGVEHVELSCTHVYCSGCLKLLLCPVPGIDFATPKCIAEVDPDHSTPCLSPIPMPVILSHLSVPDRTLLFESALLSFVRAEPDFRICVSGCPVVYRISIPGAVFTCPECGLDICPSCTVPVHIGLTCGEYQEICGESKCQITD
jgi:hypothetical protein